jgi:hypothetical protein
MKTPNYVFDDELYHHGIQGQKWYRRRYQNEDGSWTSEGRLRYGKGEAKASHDLKVYKANLTSSRKQHKDTLYQKEERNRIRELAKTNKLVRKEERKQIKEQARNERLLSKERQKISESQRNQTFKNSKKMSDDDLRQAIERLKLEVEYNKNLAIANDSKSVLAKADRFFAGPTGEAVRAVAVAAMPNIAQAFTQKASEAAFKYANKLDREAKEQQNKANERMAEVAREQAKTDIAKEKVEQERQKILLKQIKNTSSTNLNQLLNQPNQQNEKKKKKNKS